MVPVNHSECKQPENQVSPFPTISCSMLLIIPSCLPFVQYDMTQFGSALFGYVRSCQVHLKIMRTDFSLCHHSQPQILLLLGFPGGKAGEVLC